MWSFAIDWAEIPAGTFVMSSPKSEVGRDCESQHKRKLCAFRMSKYAITFEQYDAFCEASGKVKPDHESWGRGNRPVINVNYSDAWAFARWMGCRLPTEVEWEYACQAGTRTSFNTNNDLTSAQANFGNTSSYSLLVDEITDDLTKSSGSNNNNPKSEFCGKTTPVGSFAPNNWDLYDMHGNVEEWTCTYWSGDYKPTGSKPKFKSNEILMRRGGSWKHNKQCCRSAYREANYTSDYKTNYIGFRVVEGKYNL